MAPYRPVTVALRQYATPTGYGTAYDKIDKKAEEQLAKKPLEAHPEAVSTSSTTRPVFTEQGVEEQERDVDMMASVRQDVETIKDTFTLKDVPREALYIGLAGVLPYLATSLSTVFLAYDIQRAHEQGSGLLIDPQNAEIFLHIIEPVQVGYGAVILSFLGAIHWGLEWAKYGGTHGYSRYAIGVVAPAVAWPTMLLPVEYALIAQFVAFNILYFADARATVRGWAPHWYSTYRFVLTFIVGASIVISLIGRGQIADKVGRLPGPADRIKQLNESQNQALKKEEQDKTG